MLDRIEKTRPETIIERIRARLTNIGLSANEASQRAELGVSYVNDLLSGRSKNPSMSRLSQLAERALDCDLEYLTGTQLEPRRSVITTHAHGGVASLSSVLLPLFPVNMLDQDGKFPMPDRTRAQFVSPLNDEEHYAVAVADNTYSPRYRFGDTLVVSRFKPVGPLCFAIIRYADDRAELCAIKDISASDIVVLSSGGERSVKKSETKSIHRVVGVFEG